MHTSEAQKQSSPDAWLADLLSKALLLEYQKPIKQSKRKNKRLSKKDRTSSIKNRSGVGASPDDDAGSIPQLALDVTDMRALTAATLGSIAMYQPDAAQSWQQANWRLEDVPVFQLFAQVKRLLGR